jgi:tRNA (cmo5U34)-methyltransferase
LNFTLQFVPPENRLELLQAIRKGMVAGGIVILAEKVRFSPSCVEQFHDRHHTEFKRFNGYSDLEISQKRTALETVLVRDSIETHHERLKLAGFASSTLWFQCFNFAALLAAA